MKAKEKILIAGGDLRQLYCALRLSEKYDTAIAGFDEEFLISEDKFCKVSFDKNQVYDYAVLPVPPLGEEGMLNTPCCSEKINLKLIRDMLKPSGAVFAGKADENLCSELNGLTIYDYMNREELSLLNAIPTAEGAVQLAMEEMPVTLNNLKILIVGCGRIGTALINILKGFGADITVAVRNSQGTAKARIMGIKSCCTKEIEYNFDLVFNTVPSMIFNYELLKQFSQKTLFIDLASKPGGIDFEAASELGIKAIWALGLPGKTAPVTSGEIIADTVNGIIEERGESDA